MYEQAVEKIMTEMASNEKHPYVQAIGNYLVNHLGDKPEHAEEILVEGKTILKSLDAMRRVAQKQAYQGMAMLSDEEGFAVVLAYFGCWDGEPIEIPAEPEPRAVATPRPIPNNVNNVSSAKTSIGNKTTKQAQHVQISLFDIPQADLDQEESL